MTGTHAGTFALILAIMRGKLRYNHQDWRSGGSSWPFRTGNEVGIFQSFLEIPRIPHDLACRSYLIIFLRKWPCDISESRLLKIPLNIASPTTCVTGLFSPNLCTPKKLGTPFSSSDVMDLTRSFVSSSERPIFLMTILKRLPQRSPGSLFYLSARWFLTRYPLNARAQARPRDIPYTYFLFCKGALILCTCPAEPALAYPQYACKVAHKMMYIPVLFC